MRDETLRQALRYRRFAGPPRMVVLDAGSAVTADLAAGAHEMRWECEVVPTCGSEGAPGLWIAGLLAVLLRRRPDFVLAINGGGLDAEGVIEGVLADYQVPLASWLLEHPLTLPSAWRVLHPAWTQTFCVERTALPWLTSRGHRDPIHLPAAAGAAFHPAGIDADEAAALGTPLTLAAQSLWTDARSHPPPEVRAAAERLLELRKLDRAYVAGTLAMELPVLPLELRDPGLLPAVARTALAEVSLRARIALAAALRPLGLAVYGDPYWSEVLPGLEVRPMIDTRHHLPAVYRGSDVNVTLGAAGLPTGASLQTWNVPACGALLLTEEREDVLAHFEAGREIVVYREPREAADQARHYLGRPAERQALAARAHARIEQAHRYRHRLAVLYRSMRARFA